MGSLAIANFLWQRASQQLEGLCAVRSSKAKLLLACVTQWGRRVVHVFDQGLRFVLRWRKDYQLVDAEAQQAQSLAHRSGQTPLARPVALG